MTKMSDRTAPHLQDGEVLQDAVHHVLLGQVLQLVDEVHHVLTHRRPVDAVEEAAVLEPGTGRRDGQAISDGVNRKTDEGKER